MTAITHEHRAATTTNERFIDHDPSRVIRSLTDSLLAVWPKRSAPRNPSIAKVRGRIMWGQIEPMRPLYLLACGAIDEGHPVEIVVAWAKDFIAAVEAYAARKQRRQSAGVLPFHQISQRLVVSAIREDAEADSAECLVDEDDVASLEKARAERLESIDAEERKVELLTKRIAELRTR